MSLRLDTCLRHFQLEYGIPEGIDVRRVRFASDRLIEFFEGDRDVQSLKRRDIKAYRAKRLKDGVTDSTIRRELGVLRRALDHAAEEERIDVVVAVKLPPDGQPRERWFSEDEMVKIMEQIMSARLRIAISLAIGTGARRGAIQDLTVGRVDFKGGYIDYRNPKLKLTKKRRMKVKIVDWLKPILERACDGKKPDDVVIGPGANISVEFKKILKSIGIDEKGVSIHSVRRTFICWAFLNGATPAAVSAASGDTMQTLERSYVKFFPEHSAGAVNSISNPERKL